jgi:hypothetical protein
VPLAVVTRKRDPIDFEGVEEQQAVMLYLVSCEVEQALREHARFADCRVSGTLSHEDRYVRLWVWLPQPDGGRRVINSNIEVARSLTGREIADFAIKAILETPVAAAP